MRRRHWILICLALSLGVTLGWTTWAGEREYRRYLERAQSLGLIVAPSELAGPAVPANENAAGFYQSAIRSFKGLPLVDRELAIWPPSSPNLGKEFAKRFSLAAAPTTKDIDAACLKFKPAFALLHEAVRRPKLDFDRDWSMPIFSERNGIEHLTRALSADAGRLSRAGKVADAYENLRLTRRIAEQIQSESTFDTAQTASYIERVLCHSIVTVALEIPTEDSLNQARSLLQTKFKRPNLRRALQSELLTQLLSIELLRSNPRALGFKDDDLMSADVQVGRLAQIQPRLKSIQLRGAIVDAALLGIKDLPELVAKAHLAEYPKPEILLLTVNHFSYWPRMTEHYAKQALKTETYRIAALVMLEIIADYAQKGKFPTKLPARTATIKDPATGAPFSYSLSKLGCTLESKEVQFFLPFKCVLPNYLGG